MPNTAKQVADKVKDDFVDPVARGAASGTEKLAKGSKKFAKGSRAFADGTRKMAKGTQKMADRTQDWADEMTGAGRRRKFTWLALALAIVGAVIVMMARSETE